MHHVLPSCTFSPDFSSELTTANNLERHIVGAVFGAKYHWATEHNGQKCLKP